MSEKKISADVMYKFIKDCSKLSREEIAGMYAIANKRNVELEDEIKRLKKELQEKEEHITKLHQQYYDEHEERVNECLCCEKFDFVKDKSDLEERIAELEKRIADASNTIDGLKYMVIAEREDNINLEIIDFDLTLEKAKEKANKYAKKGIFESIIIAGHDRFLREW